MGKFLIIVGSIYFLYYAGMIVYDLFLKKEKVVNSDNIEVFNVESYADENSEKIKAIEIEDVENLNTPKSFIKKDFVYDESDEAPDIEELRQKYEDENEIEVENVNETENRHEDFFKNEKQSYFQELLNLAETQVQVVASQDGRKIYQVDK